ncbi:protein of unknown function [Roseovarius tolerans]|uniref:DUF927 domain-containing protein n=1 Tax=Roseovarius tolerans TaxID=74031 RepID=A0A1H8I0Z0_9RHOB|nr:DUF927 domain-containing protein [Roseovarius tolerans]SEN61954.1 protein of unknown function [Roseovarius tolerans]
MTQLNKKAHSDFEWDDLNDRFHAGDELPPLFDKMLARQDAEFGDLTDPCPPAQALLDEWAIDDQSCLPLWHEAVERRHSNVVKLSDHQHLALKINAGLLRLAVDDVSRAERTMLHDVIILGDPGTPEAKAASALTVTIMQAQTRLTPGRNWLLGSGTVEELREHHLSRHPVVAEKDGKAFVFAQGKKGRKVTDAKGMTSQYAYRIQSKIERITTFFFDIDGTDKARRVAERIHELGLMGDVYTTHSHAEKKTKNGDRFRGIIYLEEPIEFPMGDDVRRKAINEYHNRYAGMCELLGLTDIDASGMNLHQMMYTPRRASEDAEFEHYVIYGKALRYEDMPMGDASKFRKVVKGPSGPTLSKKDSSGPTGLSDGFDVPEWWHDGGRFMMFADLLDAIGWDVRGGYGWTEMMCPNVAQHSDPNEDVAWFNEGEEGSAIHCFHGHCQHLGTWQFLVLIEQAILNGEAVLPDGVDSFSALLCDPSFYPDEIDGETVAFDPADFYVKKPANPNEDEIQTQIADAKIDRSSSREDIKAFMQKHLDVDTAARARLTDALGSTSRKKGATVLLPKQIADIWKELDKEAAQAEAAKDVEARANRKTPDYIPLVDATPATVKKAAAASKWLPSGYTHQNGWFGFIDYEKTSTPFRRVCREFEVVYSADGESGSTRTNEVTIRYQHRSEGLGIVESTFRLGDTYKDSGTILGNLRNQGLDFAPNAPAESILTLLRAVSSEREAVYCAQSGWTDDRTAFVSPTGETVKQADDKRLYVLDHVMRVSDAKNGNLDQWIPAASAALKGRNASRFLPGFLGGAVGCLAQFMDTDLCNIISNEGKPKHGKTTSLKAGVAWFAVPDADGLLITGDITTTASEVMGAKSTGAMYAPDEEGTSSLSAEEQQRVALTHAGGIGRGRGKAGGGMRDTTVWHCTLGLSTERSLLARLEAEDGDIRGGAMSRIFTVNYDNAVTLNREDDADELDAYEVLAHGGAFGWAGPKFAAKLLELGVDDVKVRVSALEAEWGDGHVGAAQRVVTTGALFCVAAEIAQEAGLLPANGYDAKWIKDKYEEPEADTDKFNIRVMLKGLLDETIAQRSQYLDTDRQALDVLRLAIIKAWNERRIVAVGEPESARGEIVGYWTTTGNELDYSSVGLRARTYILPTDRIGKLGVNMELGAIVDKLIEEKAVVLPAEKSKYGKQKLWETTPGEGRVKNLRIPGAWVHGHDEPGDEVSPQMSPQAN